jgi:hypothetical protein
MNDQDDRNLVACAVMAQGGSCDDVNRVLTSYKQWVENGGNYQDFLDYGMKLGKGCPTCAN